MKIKFGKARRVITPQVPISLAGYFNARMWDHVLDDVEVRAIVFRSGAECGAILHFDLCAVPLSVCDMILARIRERGLSDFTRKNTMICATHSHTAPEIRPGKKGQNPDYLPFLVERTVDALQDAASHLKQGEVFQAMTADHRFQFNRRYWMKNGTVMTNPGKLNPEILRPEGDIDPEIPMFGILCDGKWEVIFASIVNHSDTIGGNGVSADWPGFFHRAVERALGENSMAVPLVGCAGNINHFDVSCDACQTCYAEAERIGSGYASTVLDAIRKFQPIPGDGLKVLSGEVITLPHEISEPEILEAREIIRKYPGADVNAGADMTSEDLAKGTPAVLKYFASILLEQAKNHTEQHLYLNGFVFGGAVAVVSLPAEPFVEIGLALRKEIFRGVTCLVTEQANGTGSKENGGGYIPNSWNYGRGGYETTARSNPYSAETAFLLLQKWREMVREGESLP